MDAERLYVSTAVHKTYIDLNEKGTKAAAVTYFGIESYNSMEPEKKQKEIKFNKPFIYMIRDKKTKEMLFFGVVEEPNKWKGQTCK
jgi:serpin B